MTATANPGLRIAPSRPRPVDLVPLALRRRWAADGIYSDCDIYSLFRRQVLAVPERPAVIDAQGIVSYAELDVMARCWAAGLSGIGVRPGDVVAVEVPNGRTACALDLAVAALGAVCLPYPVSKGERAAAAFLSHSGAVAVIAATAWRGYPCAARTRALARDLPHLRSVVAVGDGPVPDGCIPAAALMQAGCDPPLRPVAPDGPARILVSSGSEAEPKMVLYSHNALAAGRGGFIQALIGDSPEFRALWLVPLASAFGSSGTSVTLAVHGGTLVLLYEFCPEAALAMIGRSHPTHVLGVPAMLRMMVDHPNLARTDTSSLRMTALGGSALDPPTEQRVRERFGCAVVNVYGSADGVNCHTATHRDPHLEEGCVGYPNPAVVDVRIVDQDLADRPTGEIGEIVALGPMTPMCYVGSPHMNERYRAPDGGVRTGDLGRLTEEGCLHVVGRRGEVISRGGANISPAEIEAALSGHPEVSDAVCVPAPDPLLDERVAVCVVAADEITLESVTSYLRIRGLETHKLPEYLIRLPALPLSPAGKVDRRAAQRLVAQSLGGPKA